MKSVLTEGSTLTLGTDGPIVSPNSGYPDAQVLRRKTILKLIEAVPKARFDELKTFIAVPNVEKAEGALREAVRLTKSEFDQCSLAFGQAKDSLDELWKAEGKPGTDPLSWAGTEAKKDISQLNTDIHEIDSFEAAFLTAAATMGLLDGVIASKSTAETALTAAEEKLKAAEADQKQQTSELVKLLQEAKLYIEKRPSLTECPVCENSIEPAQIVSRLTLRISDMEGMKILAEAVTAAKKQVESQISVHSKAGKDFCKAMRALGELLRKSELSEVTKEGLIYSLLLMC